MYVNEMRRNLFKICGHSQRNFEKKFAGLLRDIRQGVLGPGDTVVFLHTGGTPLVFAYACELGEVVQTSGTS